MTEKLFIRHHLPGNLNCNDFPGTEVILLSSVPGINKRRKKTLSNNIKPFLSKTQFMRGLQCYKSLWLYKNTPDLRTPPTASQQAVFDSGTEVGIYARELFPDGKEILYEGSTLNQKAQQTQNYIKEGATTIYEATFEYDNITVMVDILHKGIKGWELYEVKGATSVKDQNLKDVAVQYYVLTGSGLEVSKVSLVYLNNEYIRHGDINFDELFKVEELTTNSIEKQPFIKEELIKLRSILSEESCVNIDIGPYCYSPYDCDFIEFCWKNVPDNSVFDLKGKGIDKYQYYKNGIVKFKDLDLDRLNQKQRMQVETELNDKTIIDADGINDFLSNLYFPQYYLDFETFMPAIPPYDGTRPYQAIPFQYSLHVKESESSELEHYELLAEPGTDPRELVAKNLSSIIPDHACVITYNSSYEKGRLKDLADRCPKYAEKLMRIHDNIVDLMIPFRSRLYYLKEMKGSYSMKAVLPALVPALNYTGLVISDGNEAMSVFSTLHLIKDKAKIEQISSDLLEYCKLDTLGMVEIIVKLRKMVS